MGKEIIFATHNKGKVKFVEKYFKNIKLSTIDFELDEPRSDDIQESVKELGIDATIEKLEDMAKIMEYGVMRTPALVIDEQVVIQGRMPKKDEINKLLQK